MAKLQPALPDTSSTVSRLQEKLALLLTFCGLAVAIILGLRATGFHQDDDITHYLIACDGWNSAYQAWHSWGRPSFTLPAAVVAHFFGITGCRIFSALQTAVVAYLAYRIARLICLPTQERPKGVEWVAAIAPALAPAFVWAQPLTMTLAHTTLTETPAAFFLTLGVWLILRGNGVWGCVAVSPMFLARYETLALAPLFAVYLIAEAMMESAARTGSPVCARANWTGALKTPWLWAAALAICWAPLMYEAVTLIPSLSEQSLHKYLARPYTDKYGSSGWDHYLANWLLYAAGGGVVALAAAGSIRNNRRSILVASLAVGLVGLHTIVYMRGSFESGGYPRFLVPITGMTAALAALGVAALIQMRDRLVIVAVLSVLGAWLFWAKVMGEGLLPVPPEYVPWLMYGLAALCALAAIGTQRIAMVMSYLALAGAAYVICFQAELQIQPLPLGDGIWKCASETVAEIEKGPYANHQGISTHAMGVFLRPGKNKAVGSYDGGRADWASAKPGTLFFWDSKYGSETKAELEELLASGTPICRSDSAGETMIVFCKNDPNDPASSSATQPADLQNAPGPTPAGE